jgi:DNA-binding transcriptional regulator YdaS (Cro superfamily)
MDIPTYLATSGQTQRALADRLGVTPALIWQWINGRRPIAVEQAIAIERESGGVVTCEEMRPDVDWAYLRRRKSAA